MNRRQFLAAWTAAVAIAPGALAQEVEPTTYGHLRGRFVYDGEPPAPKFLAVRGGIPPVPDESLVVDGDSRGIANVCVWLELQKDEPLDSLAIHPSYLDERMKKRKQTLRMAGHRFQPHIVALWTKQRLEVVNTDTVAHNAAIMLTNNDSHNLLVPPGAESEISVKNGERMPGIISCNIHPWMSARILVQDHPYMAVANAKGEFEIRNIPEGEWTFTFFHEKAGWLNHLTIDDKAMKVPRGRFRQKITAMPTDLGEIKISPDTFGK